MKRKIGFIGLGIMGKPMSKNLLKAGHSLIVYDINPDAVRTVVEAGAAAGTSPKNVAEKSEIVITMLPNSSHVREVVGGENGILEGAKPGTVLIDMSSLSPTVSREIASQVSKKGIDMLDAPVSGGEPKAIDGTLVIMVGGKQEVFEKVKDVLLDMGSNATLMGDNGSGSVTKLANQIIVNLNIAAMSEAMVLTAKAGVDPEKLYHAIRGGLAGSAVFDAKAPMVVQRNFVPGGRIDINLKDLTNVLDTAHDIGVPLPLSSQLLEIFHSLKVDGKSGLDHCGIIQFYEKLANIEVKKISQD